VGPAGLQPLTSEEYDRHTGDPKLIDVYRYLTDPVAATYDSRFTLDPPTGPPPHTGVTYFGPGADILQFSAYDPGIDLVHRLPTGHRPKGNSRPGCPRHRRCG
jgi:hypothetical protein